MEKWIKKERERKKMGKLSNILLVTLKNSGKFSSKFLAPTKNEEKK